VPRLRRARRCARSSPSSNEPASSKQWRSARAIRAAPRSSSASRARRSSSVSRPTASDGRARRPTDSREAKARVDVAGRDVALAGILLGRERDRRHDAARDGEADAGPEPPLLRDGRLALEREIDGALLAGRDDDVAFDRLVALLRERDAMVAGGDHELA